MKALFGVLCVASVGCTTVIFPLEEFAFDAETTVVDARVVPNLTFDMEPPDTGVPDLGLPDAAAPDASLPDASLPDAGLPDAGSAGRDCACCAATIGLNECAAEPLSGISLNLQGALFNCACGDTIEPGPCALNCAFCGPAGGASDPECDACMQTACADVLGACIGDLACELGR